MSHSSNQNSEKTLSSTEGGTLNLIQRLKIFCNEQITKNAFNVQVTPFECTLSTKKAASMKTEKYSHQENESSDRSHHLTKSKVFLRRNSSRITVSTITSDHTDDDLKTANDSRQGNEASDKIQLTKSKCFLNRIIVSTITSDHTDDDLKTANDSRQGNEASDKIQLTKSKCFLNRIITSTITSDHTGDDLKTANDSRQGNEASDKIQSTKSKCFLNRIIASTITSDHTDDDLKTANDSRQEILNKRHLSKSKSIFNRSLSRGVSSLRLGMKTTKTHGNRTEKELNWHDSETMLTSSIHDSSYRTNELSVSYHNTNIRSDDPSFNNSRSKTGNSRSIESSAYTSIRNSKLSNANRLRDVGRRNSVLENSDTNHEYLPHGKSPYQDGTTVTNEIISLQFLKSNFPYAHKLNTILNTVKKELTKRHILATNTLYIESQCPHGGHNIAQVFEAYYGQCIHLEELSGLPGSENFKAMIANTHIHTHTNTATGTISEKDINLFILFSTQMIDNLNKPISFKIVNTHEENLEYKSQLCFVMREVSKRFENIDVNAPEYVEHAELAKEKFIIAKKYLDQIITIEGWDTHYNLIILGGVQIHVPGLSTDYFEPLFFETRHRNRAKVLEVTQLIDCFNYDYYCTSSINHHNSDSNLVRVVI